METFVFFLYLEFPEDIVAHIGQIIGQMRAMVTTVIADVIVRGATVVVAGAFPVRAMCYIAHFIVGSCMMV